MQNNPATPAELPLKERLGFLLRDSVLYGGIVALSRLSSLITFPILTRCYSVEDYGILDAFVVLTNLLTILVVFGQDSAVARYFYEYDQASARRQMASQSLAAQLFLAALLLPALWVSAEQLSYLYANKPGLSLLFRLSLAQAPFSLLINFSQNLLKWTFDRRPFLLLSAGSIIAGLLAIFGGVYIFHVGLAGLFSLYLASRIIFAALGLFFCKKWIEIPRGAQYLRELLLFGIPYGLISALGAFIPAMDRALISNLLTTEALGFYAAGYKMASLISLPVQAFQTAWGPFSFSIFKQQDSTRTYDHILLYFTIFICMCTLFLSFSAGPLLIFLATSKYLSSTQVVFPLALGLCIQAMGWISGIGIDLSRRSYLNLYAVIPSVAVSAASILLLIEPFGVMGVAIGLCIGHAFRTVVYTLLAYRAYPLRFSLGKPLLIVAATTVLGTIVTGANDLGVLMTVVMRSGILLLFALLIWQLILTQSQRDHFLAAFRLVWR